MADNNLIWSLPTPSPDRLEELPWTWRDRAANALQNLLKGFGADNYTALKNSQSLLGGASSNLPGGMGLADITPLGTFFAQETFDQPFAPKGLAALLPAKLTKSARYTPDPDIFVTHQMKMPGSVIHDQALPYELTNLSSGITREDLMTHFGDQPESVWAIPRVEKIGPDTRQGTLLNRDIYTRRASTLGNPWVEQVANTIRFFKDSTQRATHPDDISSILANLDGYLREQAVKRNTLRFADQGARAGTQTEGRNLSVADPVGSFGLASPNYRYTSDPTAPLSQLFLNDHSLSMLASPRFQSLEQFETHPAGSRILLPPNATITPTEAAGEWRDEVDSLLRRAGTGPGTSASRDLAALIGLARGDGEVIDPNKLGNFPGLREEYLKQLQKDATKAFSPAWSHGSLNDPFEIGKARELLKELQQLPSNYAEMKNFGPLGLNSDNFRGFIAYGDNPNIENLRKAAQKRNLPLNILPGGPSDNSAESRMQAYDDLLAHSDIFIGMATPPKPTFEGRLGKLYDRPEVVPLSQDTLDGFLANIFKAENVGKSFSALEPKHLDYMEQLMKSHPDTLGTVKPYLDNYLQNVQNKIGVTGITNSLKETAYYWDQALKQLTGL